MQCQSNTKHAAHLAILQFPLLLLPVSRPLPSLRPGAAVPQHAVAWLAAVPVLPPMAAAAVLVARRRGASSAG